MTRPNYCEIKEALIMVHVRSAEHSWERREERFCSEGRRCPYQATENCPLSGGHGVSDLVGDDGPSR